MTDTTQPTQEKSPYSNTLVIETKDFHFTTIEHANGLATVVRFQLMNSSVKPGDVLLVLTGADVHFHGLIRLIEDGWALATDSQSLLPVPSVN